MLDQAYFVTLNLPDEMLTFVGSSFFRILAFIKKNNLSIRSPVPFTYKFKHISIKIILKLSG